MDKNENQLTEEEEKERIMNRLLYPNYDQLSEEEYFSPVEVFRQEIRRRLYGKALLNQSTNTQPTIWLLSPWSAENYCRREIERRLLEKSEFDRDEQFSLDVIFHLNNCALSEGKASDFFYHSWRSYRDELHTQIEHKWKDFELCVIYESQTLVTRLWKEAIMAIWKNRGNPEKKLNSLRYLFIADQDLILFEVLGTDYTRDYYSISLRNFYRLGRHYKGNPNGLVIENFESQEQSSK